MNLRKSYRKAYYNLFSHMYDKFVELHSRDRRQRLRDWLVEMANLKPEDRVLDICTGTGAVAIKALNATRERAFVVGVDFSRGMLSRAREKSRKVNWVQADVTLLPFKDNSFDVVFCAYGFYELKDREKYLALKEICRVLKPSGKFLIMEHEEPKHPIIKLLYRIRLATMGSLSSKKFIKRELEIISQFFQKVDKILSFSGNSKIIIAEGPRP